MCQRGVAVPGLFVCPMCGLIAPRDSGLWAQITGEQWCVVCVVAELGYVHAVDVLSGDVAQWPTQRARLIATGYRPITQQRPSANRATVSGILVALGVSPSEIKRVVGQSTKAAQGHAADDTNHKSDACNPLHLGMDPW